MKKVKKKREGVVFEYNPEGNCYIPKMNICKNKQKSFIKTWRKALNDIKKS